ncbi:hypothetical protein RUESEDTHA_02914 [Ruegeria sp. THAF57]|nr:hypothetical protein RUESEDTHA_02914 [Ruegeria sp. THAF57]
MVGKLKHASAPPIKRYVNQNRVCEIIIYLFRFIAI